MPVEDVDAVTLPETPDTDVEVGTEVEDGNSVVPAKPEEPFLAVSDRQVYKTREEALRGFNEAGQRIAALSAYEKAVKGYGVTPEDLPKLLDELIESRQAKEAAAKSGAAPKAEPELELSKEEQDVLKLLEKLSPKLREKLGYASKDVEKTLAELQAKVDGYETSRTQDSEQQYQSRIESSNTQVSQWMKEAAIDDPDSSKLNGIVGPLIRDYINQDAERIADWNRGGSKMVAVLKNAHDAVIKALGWSSNSTKTALTPSNASRAASTGKRIAGSTTLPQGGDATKKSATKKANAPDSEINDRAWAEFQANSK